MHAEAPRSDIPRVRRRRPVQTRLDFPIYIDVDDRSDENELVEGERAAESVRWDDL
jgi:hypothetical protein